MKSEQSKEDYALKDIINELPGYEGKSVQTLRKDIFEKHKYDRLFFDADCIYHRTEKDVYKKGKSHEYHISQEFFNLLKDYLSEQLESRCYAYYLNTYVLGTTTMKELDNRLNKIMKALNDELELNNPKTSNIPAILQDLRSLKSELVILTKHNQKVTDKFSKLYDDYQLLSNSSTFEPSTDKSTKTTKEKKFITFEDFKDDVIVESALSKLDSFVDD